MEFCSGHSQIPQRLMFNLRIGSLLALEVQHRASALLPGERPREVLEIRSLLIVSMSVLTLLVHDVDERSQNHRYHGEADQLRSINGARRRIGMRVREWVGMATRGGVSPHQSSS